MTVTLRLGLRRTPHAQLATLATIVPALVVALAATAIEAGRSESLGLGHAWPFLLAGILAPGGSQIFYTLAVRAAGPSRTSVAVGAAPLVSVVIAILALGEPAHAPLLAGAVLIVAGGVALLGEKGRPAHFRLVGLAYAALAMTLFASRDNLVRRLSETAGVARPGVAGATTLLTGTLLALVWFGLARTRPRASLRD